MSAASPLPRLSDDCDIRSLPIGPSEAFLLSRVDGKSSIEDLAHATGMPVHQVVDYLQRLADMGAVDLGDPRASSVRRRGDHTPQPQHGERGPGPRIQPSERSVPQGARQVHDDPRLQAGMRGATMPPPPPSRPPTSYAAELLDEDVDLSLEMKTEILELFTRLPELDHYALLGVDRDAEKKEIKDAYFQRVQRFHADRFYGKKLGTFKAKIDGIFSALTRASDTLGRKKSRAEYDAYLHSREVTLGVRRRTTPAPMAVSTSPGQSSPRPPADSVPADSASGPARGPDSVQISVAPGAAASSSGLPPSSDKAANQEARRRLAAQRLRGSLSSEPSGTPSQPPTAAEAEQRRDALRADLNALRKARQVEPGLIERYLSMAAEAEKAGEWASAANALRTAFELRPDDVTLRQRLEAATLEVDRAYAGKFAEQGAYEEADGRYEQAAKSFERAARGRKSGALYERAAHCLLKLGNQGRKAVELGRQAVLLAPEEVRTHLTLARAFHAEGMHASAVATVQRALELEPKNESARKLLKDFKKS